MSRAVVVQLIRAVEPVVAREFAKVDARARAGEDSSRSVESCVGLRARRVPRYESKTESEALSAIEPSDQSRSREEELVRRPCALMSGGRSCSRHALLLARVFLLTASSCITTRPPRVHRSKPTRPARTVSSSSLTRLPVDRALLRVGERRDRVSSATQRKDHKAAKRERGAP